MIQEIGHSVAGDSVESYGFEENSCRAVRAAPLDYWIAPAARS